MVKRKVARTGLRLAVWMELKSVALRAVTMAATRIAKRVDEMGRERAALKEISRESQLVALKVSTMVGSKARSLVDSSVVVRDENWAGYLAEWLVSGWVETLAARLVESLVVSWVCATGTKSEKLQQN